MKLTLLATLLVLGTFSANASECEDKMMDHLLLGHANPMRSRILEIARTGQMARDRNEPEISLKAQKQVIELMDKIDDLAGSACREL